MQEREREREEGKEKKLPGRIREYKCNLIVFHHIIEHGWDNL